MKKTLYKWLVLLVCCFVISTFVHEMGHGVSSDAVGIHVSTGFNKVGMPYKSPSDPDFRTGFSSVDNPWDMGPNTTLVLAIGFTIAFSNSKSKGQQTALMILGAFALCNSVLRLIPMLHSYLGYITKGTPYMEDEIGTGLSWYNINHIEFLKYLPSLISIVISSICLFFVIKSFKSRFGDLFSKRSNSWYFVITVVFAYILSFIAETGLDNLVRINWV